jgi:hypothetical protein
LFGRASSLTVNGSAATPVSLAPALGRHAYTAPAANPDMDRQQVFALFMVLLMVFSSVAYAATFVF